MCTYIQLPYTHSYTFTCTKYFDKLFLWDFWCSFVLYFSYRISFLNEGDVHYILDNNSQFFSVNNHIMQYAGEVWWIFAVIVPFNGLINISERKNPQKSQNIAEKAKVTIFIHLNSLSGNAECLTECPVRQVASTALIAPWTSNPSSSENRDDKWTNK